MIDSDEDNELFYLQIPEDNEYDNVDIIIDIVK